MSLLHKIHSDKPIIIIIYILELLGRILQEVACIHHSLVRVLLQDASRFKELKLKLKFEIIIIIMLNQNIFKKLIKITKCKIKINLKLNYLYEI